MGGWRALGSGKELIRHVGPRWELGDIADMLQVAYDARRSVWKAV